MKKIYSIFGLRELQELAGNRRYYNWIVLFSICTLTLFTLGSAFNIKEFLSERMDDPFVKMVTIEVPMNCNEESKHTAKHIENSIKNNTVDFDVESAKNLYAGLFEIKIEGQTNTHTAVMGCVEDENETIWQAITAEKNRKFFITSYASSTLFKPYKNGGKIFSSVIITEDFAKKIFPLSYDELIKRKDLPAYIFYESDPDSSPDSIPISGIIKNLPCELDALTSSEFYKYFLNGEALVKNINDIENDYWMSSDNFDKMGDDTTMLDHIKPGASFSGGYSFYFGGNKDAINTTNWHKSVSYDNLSQEINNSESLNSQLPYKIIVSFTSLKKIRTFAEYIRDNSTTLGCNTDKAMYGVDLSKVESKENIDVFNGISIILLVSLAIASLILIVNYCISILRMHIEKNRANLGTLKAFGFSNKGILMLYASVTSALLGSAFIVAYLFTYVLGNLLLGFILDLMDLTSKTEGLIFSNIPLYYSLPLFVIAPVLLILLKVKGILQLTPGALVFQRENQ